MYNQRTHISINPQLLISFAKKIEKYDGLTAAFANDRIRRQIAKLKAELKEDAELIDRITRTTYFSEHVQHVTR